MILDDFLPNGKFCAYWFDQDVVNKPPWLDQSRATNEAAALRRVTGAEIDQLFFSEFGERAISKFLKGVDPDNETSVKQASLKVLSLCYLSWLRLTEDYVAQYDPVQNYSMEESGTDVITRDGIGVSNNSSKRKDLTYSEEAGYSVDTPDGAADYKVTNKPAETTNTQQSAPYDSDTFKNEQKNTVTVQTNAETTEQGTRGSDVKDHSDENRQHTFQRAGNIGVMTATQMIENDSAFWAAHNFFDRIAADVASYITIPIYE